MSDIDMTDILGFPTPKPKAAPKPDTPVDTPIGKNGTLHPSMFTKPVGVTFLASVVGKQPKQIEKRLAKCRVAEWKTYSGKDQPMYNFLEAMAYLIPPKGNIEDWFAQQNAASLPAYVNKMWWDSAHQRNRVMMASGDLWHTDDVMVLFGRVSMTIRESTKMWIEELPDKDKLTDAQFTALLKSVDKLMGDMQAILVSMPREILSMSSHIQSELDANSTIPDDADRAEETDE